MNIAVLVVTATVLLFALAIWASAEPVAGVAKPAALPIVVAPSGSTGPHLPPSPTGDFY